MASLSEIARPYAKAAFELAVESGDFDAWLNALVFAQALSFDHSFHAVLRKTKRSSFTAVVAKLAEGIAEGQQLRFVQNLVDSGRLDLSEKIHEIFSGLLAAKEGFASVLVTSAKPVEAAEAKSLVTALERQFGKKLKASFKVDPAIEGGFIARVGDKVYDASVRGALERISNALLN